MPIYEFRCAACGHEFEDLVTPKAAAEMAAQVKAVEDAPCPGCGEMRVGLVMSAFSLRGPAPGAVGCATTGGS